MFPLLLVPERMVIPLCPLVDITKSSALAFPCGVLVPIRTLPSDVMRILSVFPIPATTSSFLLPTYGTTTVPVSANSTLEYEYADSNFAGNPAPGEYTCKCLVGLVRFIPTLPVDVMRTFSPPPICKRRLPVLFTLPVTFPTKVVAVTTPALPN